jgi:maltose O-acetyltransferase
MEKTEKQKMLAGELYLAEDPELAAENKRASRLLRRYNSTTEANFARVIWKDR